MDQLEIALSLKGETPIYEQIETQIKDQILSGKLDPGQSIPSMRTLAKLLRVSVITVQKAYENLKREGFIESVVGRGTIVAAVSHERHLEEKRKELQETLEKAIGQAKPLGLSLQELQDLLAVLYEETL